MRKAIAILPVVSAIYPMITGATAPPTIVMISNEEASLVFVPASLNASEKIVGNMMLSPRYRAKNAMRDKVPLHTTTINVATKVRMAQTSSTSLGWWCHHELYPAKAGAAGLCHPHLCCHIDSGGM